MFNFIAARTIATSMRVANTLRCIFAAGYTSPDQRELSWVQENKPFN
jgi:hypothetical protein